MCKHLDCFFCKEMEDPVQNILQKNRIVYETKNFVVFPTVGCFRIGYLLVVPKQHFLCFGQLTSELIKELNGIVCKITDYIQKKQGSRCIIFEHGTRDLSKLNPTSIMHAHIHIIPFEEDIISYLPDHCELRKIRGFTDLKNETDNYLFLKDTNGNSYIIKNNNYPSQFFRRIACKAIGKSKYWNWRRYKFVKNMKLTIDYYDKL